MALRGRGLAAVLFFIAALVTAAAAAKQQDAGSISEVQQDSKQAVADSSTAAAPNANVLPGDVDPLSEAMLEWLRTNGAEVNVAIRANVPGSGRGTFAPHDIKKGDILARIPVEMVYALTDQDDTLAVSGTYLVADMAEDNSPWAPYFNCLPGPTGVWSSANLPLSYLPTIQDEYTELAIEQVQESITNMWDTYGDTYKKVMGPNVKPANITYAVALLLTRLFRFDSLDILIPVLDMANHQNGCLHSHMPESCDPEEGLLAWQTGNRTAKLAPTAGSGVYGAAADSDSNSSSDGSGRKGSKGSKGMSGQCMVWRAEEDVAAGQEVCNSYKTLFQDRALLQYGFLQNGAPVHELNMLDRHEQKDAGPADVWADPDDLNNLHGPRRFEGSPSELREEVGRLSARLANLEAAEPTMQAIKPDPEMDAEGHRLAVMLEWRRQRKAAIRTEIARLEKQASRVEQWQQVWGADRTGGLEKVNTDLLTWLDANKGQVSVELKPLKVASASSSKDQQTCRTAPDSSSSQPACSTEAGQGAVPSFPPNAGVFTTKEVKQGNMLAVIPVELGYSVRKGIQKLASAIGLMTDIQAALSPGTNPPATDKPDSSSSSSSSSGSSNASTKAALLRSLPPFGSVRGLVNFPPEYLPILQQPRAEMYIKLLQNAVSDEFESHRPQIEARDNSTSHAELRYAVALIANQRPLASVNISGEEQQLLAPFYSNARYSSSCPHNASVEPCPGGSSSSSSSDSDSPQCFFWRAGADLPAGAEVCVLGPYLRNDQALLMYGLTMEQAAALRQQTGAAASSSSSKEDLWLSGLDSQASSNEEPFGLLSHKPLEHWVAGDREEALTECVWLQDLHTNWTSPETAANISSIPAAASDPDGAFLQELLLWRQQRIASVEWELARLMKVWNISSVELNEAAAQQHAAQEDEAGDVAEDDAGRGASGSGNGAAIDSDFESDSSDPWQRMLDWMRHNGALINVNVTDAGPQHGRVVVVNEPMLRGDLLAAIPIDLVWNANANGANHSLQGAAAMFAANLELPDSPHRPYFDALPSQDEVMCPLIYLPAEYLHLLQSPKAESYITRYQENLADFWEEAKDQMLSSVPSLTVEKFLYARALLATRLFGLQVGTSMVPLLDLANHAVNCPNVHVETACPHDPDRDCIVWTAGAYIPDGGEACNVYKWMPNDRCLLQYGFLQAGPISEALYTMDYSIVNETNFLTALGSVRYAPEPFEGTESELEAELARLQATLTNITSYDDTAAAATPIPADKNGRMLSMLLALRQGRKAALKKEIDRLQKRLSQQDKTAAAAAAAAAAAGGKRCRPLSDKQQEEGGRAAGDLLVDWIKDNGGQVNHVQIAALPQPSTAVKTSSCGVFASHHIKAGQVLAVVPLELALAVNTRDLLLDAPRIYSDLHQPLNPLVPYYATLPPPSEGFSYFELPLEYAPVIQHAPTMEFLQAMNESLAQWLEENHDLLSWRNMTLSDLLYVFSLTSTRLMSFREGGHLIPLIDMANHQDGCKHTVAIKACGSASSDTDDTSSSSSSSQGGLNTTKLCVVWEAGADVAAGEEVCVSYGHLLLPDRAMLQYGFMPQDLAVAAQQQQQQQQQWSGESVISAPVPLFGMDRHDFKELSNLELPWRFGLTGTTNPQPFAGTSKETVQEVLRLQQLAQELTAGDAAAAAVQHVPSDPQGHLLQQLLLWRGLREAGIEQEIQRLQQQQQQPEQQQQLKDRDEL